MSPKKSSKTNKGKKSQVKAKPAVRKISVRAARKKTVKEKFKKLKKKFATSAPLLQKPSISEPVELIVERPEPENEEEYESTTRRILEKLRESGIVEEEKPKKKPVAKAPKSKKLKMISAVIPRKHVEKEHEEKLS